MQFGKLFLFILTAAAAVLVSGLFGGLLAESVGVDGGAGFTLGAALSASGSLLRMFAPGLFGVAALNSLAPTAGIPGMRVASAQRAQLDAIVAECRKAGLTNAIPLPSYLRAEVTLGSAQNSITFEVAANQQVPGQTQSPTENRLKVNDAFYPSHYGLFFSTWATATANARSRAQLYSFANTVVFGANAPEVDGAYNGYGSLRVNDRVYFDSLDLMRFKRVTPAQQGLAVSTAAADNKYFGDGWEGDAAFAHLPDPLVRLNGQFSNKFTAHFPISLDFTKVAANTVSAVLYLRGWLVQNAGTARFAD